MSLNAWLDLAILTAIWIGVAAAWNILAGFAGQFSLGHAAFFGIGAYTPTLLATQLHQSPWLGIALGAGLAAVFALGIAAISLRARGPFFALMTIAFAEVTRILAIYFKPLTRGSEGVIIDLKPGLANLFFLDKAPYLAIAALYAAAMIGLSFWILHSRLGYRLLALREDEDAARSLGVPVFRARVAASMISAACAAVGGSLMAFYTQFIDPDSTLSFFFSIQPALITIVGGLGHPIGPLLGAIVVVPLDHLLRGWLGGTLFGLHGFIFGVLLIVILLTMPDGPLYAWRRWRRSGGRIRHA